MTFGGLRKDADIVAVVAYIGDAGGSGDQAAEQADPMTQLEGSGSAPLDPAPSSGGGRLADTTAESDATEDALAEGSEAAPELAAMMEAGEAGYLANCRPCHGTNGTAGVSLAGNEKVSAGFDYLVYTILTGPGYMPTFHEALSDQQIAEVSTYILNSWGNSYGPVLPGDIASLR